MKLKLVLLLTCSSAMLTPSFANRFLDLVKEAPGKIRETFPTSGNDKPAATSTPESEFEYESETSNYKDRSPIDDLAEEDIRKARTIGKYSGAAAGAIIGHYVGENNADSGWVRGLITTGGTLVGGWLGDSLGKSIGKVAANRRKQYASEYEYLESEIAASERAISMREGDIAETDAEIASMQRRITELNNKQHLQAQELEEARLLKAQIDAKVEENSIKIIQYQEKLAYLASTLEESESEKNATEEERELWAQKHQKLTDKKEELNQQFARLQKQGKDLKESQDTLVALLN